MSTDQKPAPCPSEPTPGPWRIGRKLARTIYFHDRCVGMVDTPGLAIILVTAANEREEKREEPRSNEAKTTCAYCGESKGHSKRCSVTRHGAEEERVTDGLALKCPKCMAMMADHLIPDSGPTLCPHQVYDRAQRTQEAPICNCYDDGVMPVRGSNCTAGCQGTTGYPGGVFRSDYRPQEAKAGESRTEIIRDAAALLRFCAGMAERNRHGSAVVEAWKSAADQVEGCAKEAWRSPTLHGPLPADRTDNPTPKPCARCAETEKALLALDERTMQAEDAKDIYDDVRDTVAKLVIR